jgi:hypothetical protein
MADSLSEQRKAVESLATTSIQALQITLDLTGIPAAFVMVVIRDSSGITIRSATAASCEGDREQANEKADECMAKIEEIVEQYVHSLPGVYAVPEKDVS